MWKLIIITILLSLTGLKGQCQQSGRQSADSVSFNDTVSVASLNLIEVAKNLEEYAECRELVEKKNEALVLKDSVIAEKDCINDSLEKEIKILEARTSELIMENKSLDSMRVSLENKIATDNYLNIKNNKRRTTWEFIGAGLLVLVGLL